MHRKTASMSPGNGPSTRLFTGTTPSSGPPIVRPLRPASPAGREVDVPDPGRLLRLAPGTVNSRQGAVLGRGFLLKTDYYASGRAKDLAHHLQGAPNFRTAQLGIFGSAQPTLTGLLTVLTFLRAHPSGRGKAVWFCTREEPLVYIGGRPFVLRDSARPTQAIAFSERAENIEGIEQRLKVDVLKEASRYGGLVLVHEELVEGEIIPTWIAAPEVKTVREVFEGVRLEGYHVEYHRIPISTDQAPEDSYLDRYVAILKHIPTSSSLVFNCGMGVVRTTFAMSAAVVMRRRQVIKEGGSDVFSLEEQGHAGRARRDEERALHLVGEQQRRTRGLLRLMQLLQKCLPASNQTAVIELLTTRPELLPNLQKGIMGEYDIILSLVSILDQGRLEKDLVDMVVNSCDDVINLRDDILENRLRFAVTAADETEKTEHIRRALTGLERYFFLMAFASYCNEPPMSFNDTFSPWLRTRTEIMNMIQRLRTTARQYVFAPVHDLASLSQGEAGAVPTNTAIGFRPTGLKNTPDQIAGLEWAHYIVQNRNGITLRGGLILKSDQWPTQFPKADKQMPGATNFRRVPESSLFGLSQPTEHGIDLVLQRVRAEYPKAEKIIWINLREEPLICVNGAPYVLRLDAVSLRNIKSYAGISSSRLELLEERLKSDVIAELRAFDGRILLHTETDDGLVIPVWQNATADDVKTLREIMDTKAKEIGSFTLQFYRQPITAEKPPDFDDVKGLIEIVSNTDSETPHIVNCQLGRGRSTLTLVCIILVQRWLKHGGRRFAFADAEVLQRQRPYQMINNLVRVMRNGQGIKAAVDQAVVQCSAVYDLIESIEMARRSADEASQPSLRDEHTRKGLHNLRRYAFLCIFACYLNETKADTWRDLLDSHSFERFWENHQVFKTIQNELIGADIQALTPLEMSSAGQRGLSWTEEEQAVVAGRKGLVLSAQTMLKSDFFLGLQKMTLPLKITGLPNIRQHALLLDHAAAASEQCVFGCGMPTVDGLRRGLERMGAAEGRNIFWTSMREEPVLYIKGKPHVLRLFDQPLENVITTGVSTAAVEGMEVTLKSDVYREIQDHGGRILLHDEIEEDGQFHVNALWESVGPEDILTPREVFEQMQREDFSVNYARLPVTDEQAPLPGVFSRLESRVAYALEQEKTHLVFNCQMGRGRTTTGMVAATLCANILFRRESVDLSGSVPSEGAGTASLSTSVDALDTWDKPESDPYVQGDYKTILQLVGVLSHGRLAKKLADKAIDAMDAVQNLRNAISDFKVRAEAAEPGGEKQRKILHAANNYLYRYGALIAFSNWLLERADLESEGGCEPPPFPEWLQRHPEISHILARKALD